MLGSLCLVGLAGLLIIGALLDIEYRRLPNWLTSAVALLYGLFVAVSPAPVDWISAFAVAAVIFALGFAAFAFQMMGGGDVKLMAGLSLWAGADHIALFLLVTSLGGGLLAIVMMLMRKWAETPLITLLSPLPGVLTKRLPLSTVLAGSPSSIDAEPNDLASSLPYGVAIAAGGFAVIFALLKL